jgi:hypothetical protein
LATSAFFRSSLSHGSPLRSCSPSSLSDSSLGTSVLFLLRVLFLLCFYAWWLHVFSPSESPGDTPDFTLPL